jgi:glycosyltransferase involved in cell wall biosynthesis
MRVIFCPYDERNPYQRELAAELARLDVPVVPMRAEALYRFAGRRAWSADIFHLHWLHHFLVGSTRIRAFFKSLVLTAQVAVRRLLGQRIVWTAHNLLDHERRFPGMQLFFTRLVARMAHRVIVHSHAAAAIVGESLKVSSKKLRVIPHAHYIGVYPDEVDSSSARAALGVPPDRFVFLFIGKLRDYKGVHEAIEAFRRLEDESAQLVIAGRPKDEQVDQQMRKWIADHPRIDYRPGFVADEQLQVYFRAADIVVLPFHDVLTSGSLLLAMSFAKPLILPDLAGLREAVPNGGAIFCSANDSTELTAALRQAIEQREQLAAKGNVCYEFVKNWGWAEMAKATAEVYKER